MGQRYFHKYSPVNALEIPTIIGIDSEFLVEMYFDIEYASLNVEALLGAMQDAVLIDGEII